MIYILCFLVCSFVQKEYIPYGTSGPNGRVLLGDFNRNSKTDIIFTGYSDTLALGMIFERQDSNAYVIVDTIGYYLAVWDVGDFDADGLYDVVTDGDYFIGITVYESLDSFSYPTQEVWRDTVGQAIVTAICAYDIDIDSLPEIAKVSGDFIDLHIYETTGNNTYEKISEITTPSTHTASSTLAFGDFDADNQNEFVWGYTGGEYSIFECIDNNSYQETAFQQLQTANIKDCFTVPDADGDGKLEFVIKGFTPLDGRTHCFIFEAIADNTYEIIDSFNLTGGDYYGGYSDAGDVDGDFIPEIVLESCQYVYIIKSAGNDSFYVWDTLPGLASNVRIFDIDSNGLSEIIISGNNETRIFEYTPGAVEEATLLSSHHVLHLEVYPNPFSELLNLKFQIPNPNGQTNSNLPHSATLLGGLADQIPNYKLQIYDATGRLVKSFNYQTIQPSNHLTKVVWSGDDDLGRRLPSGVYFVQLEYEKFKQVAKVILIK